MQATIPSAVNQFSAAAVEIFANRILALDPTVKEKLEQFSDKIIHLYIEDFSLNYYFFFVTGSIVVQQQSERPASVSVSGKSSAFLAAATATHSSDSIFNGELHFSGEINTAQRFQNFVQSLNIDWQEPISRVFGDVIGHNISQGISKAGQFIEQLLNNTRQDVPDYLQHEIRVLPCHIENNDFLQQVDTLRSQTDRLIARVDKLLTNK